MRSGSRRSRKTQSRRRPTIRRRRAARAGRRIPATIAPHSTRSRSIRGSPAIGRSISEGEGAGAGTGRQPRPSERAHASHQARGERRPDHRVAWRDARLGAPQPGLHVDAGEIHRRPRPVTIYFAGSIRGGRGDQAIYEEIIDRLRRYGTVLTEHVGDVNLLARRRERRRLRHSRSRSRLAAKRRRAGGGGDDAKPRRRLRDRPRRRVGEARHLPVSAQPTASGCPA